MQSSRWVTLGLHEAEPGSHQSNLLVRKSAVIRTLIRPREPDRGFGVADRNAPPHHLMPALSVHHGQAPETVIGVWVMVDSVEPPAGNAYSVLARFGNHHEEHGREAYRRRIAGLRPTRLELETRAA